MLIKTIKILHLFYYQFQKNYQVPIILASPNFNLLIFGQF